MHIQEIDEALAKLSQQNCHLEPKKRSVTLYQQKVTHNGHSLRNSGVFWRAGAGNGPRGHATTYLVARSGRDLRKTMNPEGGSTLNGARTLRPTLNRET